jgi:hypothetical protein
MSERASREMGGQWALGSGKRRDGCSSRKVGGLARGEQVKIKVLLSREMVKKRVGGNLGLHL